MKLKQTYTSAPFIQYRLRSVKAGIRVTMEERICEGDVLIVASVSSVGAGRLLTRQNRFIFTLTRWPNEVTASRVLAVLCEFPFYRQSLITPYAAFNVAIISDSFLADKLSSERVLSRLPEYG